MTGDVDTDEVPAVVDPWHLDPVAVATTFGVDPARGLTSVDAARRLEALGPNKLREAPARPWWRAFLAQVVSPLNLVLVLAAALAGVVERSFKEAVVIGLVLGLNGVLGFIQERRADRAVAALTGLLAPSARVRRDGDVVNVPTAELVPGDVVLVDAGDRIPADGRVLWQVNLETDESTLTGESVPVTKSAEPQPERVALADRTSMVHMSSVATRGHAEVLVTSTGMRTEIGRTAGLLERVKPVRTPLERQLDKLGVRLAWLAGVAVLLVAVMEFVAGSGIGEVITLAVALGVAAIPEGLPAVVTVTLALGMRRMARQRAIVKRLAAVETLGATTVICTDKTGTLTLNQMTVRSLWYSGRRFRVTGNGYTYEGTITALDGGDVPDLGDLLGPAVLCNDATVHDDVLVGDPTEGALVTVAAKAGLDVTALRDAQPRITEIPFDSALKYMATFHRDGPTVRVYVKGAADVLVDLVSHLRLADGDVPLDERGRQQVLTELDRLAVAGERVLAVAVGADAGGAGDPALPERLVLTGLIGILDPVRPEANAAVTECRAAGIDVKVITGDHLTTAASVAQAIGLRPEGISGQDIDRLDDESFARAVADVSVFARVAPEHKIRIVRTLQRRGETVAMTGDGVNDAPALKGADIGVVMGRTGSDVAKDAGSMVLTDDNFATIVGAVRVGRTIYDNIVKFVRFQITTNVAAILTVVLGSILFLAEGDLLNPLMLLWVNVIADGPPALTLGLEPTRPAVMTEPPRPRSAHILNTSRIARIALSGSVMVAGTLLAFHLGLDRGAAVAQTLAFTTFVMFQMFNILNVRDEHASAFGSMLFRNWKLWASIGAVIVLHMCAVYVPVIQTLFGTTALTGNDWIVAVGTASSVLWVEEIGKAVRSRIR